MLRKTIISVVAALGAAILITWLTLPPHRVDWGRMFDIIANSFGLVEVVFLAVLGIVISVAWAVYRLYSAKRYGPMVALAVAVFGILVIWFPRFQVAALDKIPDGTNRPQLENEYRRTWAGILGGFVLFGGIVVAWRRADAAMRQAAATEQGNITERFTRAIDQLGAMKHTNEGDQPNLEVRMGGISALEMIVNDAPRVEHDRYLAQVAMVLQAYVQENAKLGTTVSGKVRSDVQMSISVLGRLVNFPITPIGLIRFEFSNLDLPGLNLTALNTPMMGWNFNESNLVGAQLVSANISLRAVGACLEGANLSSAILQMADLRGANLKKAMLIGTNFWGALLSGTQFQGAIMNGATISRRQLIESHFDETTILLRGESGLTKEMIRSWTREQCQDADLLLDGE